MVWIFFLVINQLNAQNLFYSKFISCLYMFWAPCAHRQEVKIVLYSLWYHHTYPDYSGYCSCIQKLPWNNLKDFFFFSWCTLCRSTSKEQSLFSWMHFTITWDHLHSMSNKIQLNAYSKAQIVISVCTGACARTHTHTHTHKTKPNVWSSRT